jgi:hypothetical protein
MFKRALTALALATSINAVADPILLPGNVVIENPAVATSTTGNLNSSLQFVQWFEVANPNDPSDTVIVGMDDIMFADGTPKGVLFSNLFAGIAPADDGLVTALDFVLTGVGELTLGTGSGDLSCGVPCELTFTFGGVAVGANGFDLGQSYIEVYLSDLLSNFNRDSVFSDADDASLFNEAEYLKAFEGTPWLTGIFEQAFYSPTAPDYIGLQEGNLKAAVDVIDDGAGIANNNVLNDTLRERDFGTDFWFDALAFSLEASFFDFDATNNTTVFARGNSGDFTANVVNAPGTLALFGLGLLGMGIARRKFK